MSEQRAPYLTVVRTDTKADGQGGESEQAEQAEQAEQHSPHSPQAVVGNAVMYAAMSWVACCMERPGIEVSVSPLGSGLFDAAVRLADGGSVCLRVTLVLEAGPRVRTQVEPIHP